MLGPQNPFSDSLHAEKYRAPGESFREAMNRVASALRDSDDHYHAFRDALLDMRFMPGGRIQAAMGSTRDVTPYNCFVSQTIQDSFTTGQSSIMTCASRAAETMRRGGGIGYDFSTLRPRGALIKKLQSNSSGPVSFMEIFDAICRCVSSSGHRRGAQMGVMRIDHPDIEEFIHAKRQLGRLEGFNISVAVTDEFMEAVAADEHFDLRFEGQVYKTIRARVLWETLMRSCWDWAEPGVLFIDTINRMNNLSYCETIAATNPCGEQPLPPDGACLLGSFNLVKYLREVPTHEQVGGPGNPAMAFDYDQLVDDIPHVVRAMDNVVDRAEYPLYEQEQEAKRKRRMGLGVTGVANAIEALGFPYGSKEFCTRLESILLTITIHAYKASIELAKEKGPFPAFERQYVSSPFLDRPEFDEIRQEIRESGIRNSHLLSIAPTGTISLCADNISSGIEPVFAYRSDRVYIGPDGPETIEVRDYGVEHLHVRGKRARDVTVREHLDVLITAARWVDSAVSKTTNLTAATPWEEFKDLYLQCWRAGVKGCTVYNVDGKRNAVLTSKDEEGAACYIDPESGRRECE
jgi:ribonucleoside-diphosphate reductase alpha chain